MVQPASPLTSRPRYHWLLATVLFVVTFTTTTAFGTGFLFWTRTDVVIDLGPEGGDGGGEVVVSGTPDDVAKCKRSYTGQFLKRML